MKARTVSTFLAVGGLCSTALAAALSFSGPGLASAAPRPVTTVTAKERAAVIAWVTAHQSLFNKLETGFQAAANAASKNKIQALHNDCLSLKKVITTVKAAPPIPDATIELVFKSSLANLMAGTLDCISGTSTSGSLNPSLLNKASKYWETGGNQLIKVGEELNSVAG